VETRTRKFHNAGLGTLRIGRELVVGTGGGAARFGREGTA
jgi:hypothetical protein